ncbi:MAG: IS3 family transposase [Mycoplasmataceae bacterium]|nr:IS3 family transposase [Mycoplasmataceae bacterium]
MRDKTYIQLKFRKNVFKELEDEITNFIHYYNNVKIKEKLNWMTHTQYRNHL